MQDKLPRYNVYDIVPVLNILKDKLTPQRSEQFIEGLSFGIAMVSIAIKRSLHYNQHLINKQLQEELEDVSYQYVTEKKKLQEEIHRLTHLLEGDKPTALKQRHRRFIYELAYGDYKDSEKVKTLKLLTKNWNE
jgi:hypothetical protein